MCGTCPQRLHNRAGSQEEAELNGTSRQAAVGLKQQVEALRRALRVCACVYVFVCVCARFNSTHFGLFLLRLDGIFDPPVNVSSATVVKVLMVLLFSLKVFSSPHGFVPVTLAPLGANQ